MLEHKSVSDDEHNIIGEVYDYSLQRQSDGAWIVDVFIGDEQIEVDEFDDLVAAVRDVCEREGEEIPDSWRKWIGPGFAG